MNQLKGKNLYKSATDCAVQIWKHEGFTAFYKGFTPFALMNIPWAMIFFVAYEFYKHSVIPLIVKQ